METAENKVDLALFSVASLGEGRIVYEVDAAALTAILRQHEQRLSVNEAEIEALREGIQRIEARLWRLERLAHVVTR